MIQSVVNSSSLVGFGSTLRAGKQPSGREDAASGLSGSNSSRSVSPQSDQLTADQLRQIEQLKQTDRKVRAHEQAHLAVGRDLALGGASYSYQTGPDKKQYAVGGEVSINTSPGRTPEETIPKAQHIRATALAPADPSSQDQRVAAMASQMETEARIELIMQKMEQASSSSTAVSHQDRTGTGLYLGVAQNDAVGFTVGGSLDSYA